MIMGAYNRVGMRYNNIFYTVVISQCQQQLFSKVIVGLCILRIVRVNTILYEVFFILRVNFDVLISKKKVL